VTQLNNYSQKNPGPAVFNISFDYLLVSSRAFRSVWRQKRAVPEDARVVVEGGVFGNNSEWEGASFAGGRLVEPDKAEINKIKNNLVY